MAIDLEEGDASIDYSGVVAARIRTVRGQMNLSLRDVERVSRDEFKASVLGAYERGERSISVPRLERLAQIYGVPIEQLLPPRSADATAGDGPKVAIDLTSLRHSRSTEGNLLRHLLASVQVQRQDFNGRVITIRGDDLRVMAAMFGRSIDAMLARLEALDLIHRP